MNGHGAVVEPAVARQGRPDHEGREQPAAGVDQPLQLALHRLQERVLQQEVVDGVGREAQLREDHHAHVRRVTLLEQDQGLLGVEGRVGYGDARDADADPDEVVGVGGEEVHSSPWRGARPYSTGRNAGGRARRQRAESGCALVFIHSAPHILWAVAVWLLDVVNASFTIGP